MTRPHRWHASWIWSGPPALRISGDFHVDLDQGAADGWACFRRGIDLRAAPTAAPCRVSADSRYVLWANGTEVARGPVRANPRLLHYDEVDLARHLRPGHNVLAALVRFYGEANAWWMPAPPTFTLGAGGFLLEARLGDHLVVTDSSWRAHAPTAWSRTEASGVGAGRAESFDARRLPADWRTSAFDDSDWTTAHVVAPVHIGAVHTPNPPSPPYGPMLPNPLPAPTGDVRDARLLTSTTVPGATDLHDPVLQVDADERSVGADGGAPGVTLLTYDFGGVVAGILEVALQAPAGTRLDLSCAEALDSHDRLARLGQHTGLRYVARGRADRHEVFDPVGTRYVRVALRPPDGAEVPAPQVTLRERHRPRPPGPTFECSDASLTRIYEVGLRTVDLCAHDAYVDCPTREQRAWTGDSVVHQMVDLATNPDWSLARRHPVLAASPRPDGMLPMAVAGDFEADDATYIPDWPLHWVRSVHNLYRFAGDRDLVRRLLPVVESLLRWFLAFRDGDGLVHDVTGWVLVDWSSVQVAGTCSALNALWARALRDLAEMASWSGDEGRARWARELYEGVRRGFEAFWDEPRGVYVDHLVDGVPARPVSQHGSAAALAAGLVDAGRAADLVATITDRSRLVRRSFAMDPMTPDSDAPDAGMLQLAGPPPAPDWDVDAEIVEAQPFFRYVVHDAVAAAGRADLIADLCRDWQVFLARGETSWPETWNAGTHCHGWSSTPTRDLVRYTLGIGPEEPGFVRARVAPRLGDLAWARGSAPTPHGLVAVDVDRDRVVVDTPVPTVVDAGVGAVHEVAPGRHTLPIRRR